MSEPKLIRPMLDGFAMGQSISSHHGVQCYPAMPGDSDRRYIVKIISIPASPVQMEALLLSGACANREAALGYFKDLADGVGEEVQILKNLARLEGFLPYEDFQIEPHEDGSGYDVYLLSPYRRSLAKHFEKKPMTHLAAVNLGLDLCASMAVCRRAGFLYVDLKPENIFVSEDNEYRVGDLGFIRRKSLKYASLPDKYRSAYTPPEISDAMSDLHETMDIYAIGLILYQAFNGGELPFDPADPQPVTQPPLYADYEMAEIIMKACAQDPQERWPDPIAMGQELVAYLQRNTVNDTPIIPQCEPLAEEVPDDVPMVEDAEPAEADQAPETAEDAPASQEEADDAEGIAPEAVADPESPEMPEENAPAEEDAADLSFLDAMVSDDTTPDAQPQEDVAYEELSQDASDILSMADDLIAHETPEPVIAPEPIDVPMPDPVEPEAEPEVPADAPEDAPAQSESVDEDASETGEEAPEPESETAPAEDGNSASDEDDEDEEETVATPNWKKVLIGLVCLLLAAALVAGAYTFYNNYYLQSIEDLQIEGQENSLTVRLDTQVDPSLLQVTLSSAYGHSQTGKVENGVVTFQDLVPNTMYNIQVSVDGLHKLVGQTSGSYTTPRQTNIVSFSATAGSEDGSAIFSFTIDGEEPTGWVLEYETEGENTRTVSFTGHMVTVNGLTMDKTYTFRLKAASDMYLVGNDTLNYTVTELIYPQDLTVTACGSEGLTLVWAAPQDTAVESWTVHCYNDTGYSQLVTTQDTTLTLTDIDPTQAYNVEVSAAGMTVSAKAYVSANSTTISNIQSSQSQATSLSLSWDASVAVSQEGWLVMYATDGGEAQVVRTQSNGATLAVIPGEHYTVTIQAADGSTVFDGQWETTIPAAESFTGYGVTSDWMTFRMCRQPDKSGWDHYDVSTEDYTSTFTPGEKAAFVVQLSRKYNTSSDEITSLFVIRDSNGGIVSTNTSSSTWTNMWYKYYCELDIPALPETPGTYTISLYFNGMIAHQQSFTIS